MSGRGKPFLTENSIPDSDWKRHRDMLLKALTEVGSVLVSPVMFAKAFPGGHADTASWCDEHGLAWQQRGNRLVAIWRKDGR